MANDRQPVCLMATIFLFDILSRRRKIYKLKAVSAISGGHSATLTGEFHFLLVFYSNHMPKMHYFTFMGAWDRQRHGGIDRLMLHTPSVAGA